MSKILTFHTVPHNFKSHQCITGADEGEHDALSNPVWNLFQILASRKLYKDIQGTTFFPRVLMTLALVSIKSILPALLHISHNFCSQVLILCIKVHYDSLQAIRVLLIIASSV